MAAGSQREAGGRAREAAVTIVRTLQDAGHVAYLAGGCVRDELLGLEPADYDIATDARPDRIRSLFRRTAAVGASFGVVLVKELATTIEVATFRSDGPYSDRRRPDHVEFSDARHDAERRDFTINALFLDPLASADSAAVHGHAIDFVGGLADLGARVIRAVGEPEARLAEDHLRTLRAVRFAARFGFEIEPATAAAIRAHASELAGVSRERIGDELRRMLAHPTRGVAARLLRDLTLDEVVFGPPAGRAPGEAMGRLGPDASFACCLAAWALDRGAVASAAQIPGLVAAWRRGLSLSNDESDRLRDVLGGTLEAEQGWDGLPLARKKRRAAAPCFADVLALVASRNPQRGREIRAEVERLADDGIGLAPPPLIDGSDLLADGLPPGPVFARVLRSVYDAQLEGRVRSKDGALRLAAELAGGGGV